MRTVALFILMPIGLVLAIPILIFRVAYHASTSLTEWIMGEETRKLYGSPLGGNNPNQGEKMNTLTDIQIFQAHFDVLWGLAQKLDASYGKEIVAKLRECIPVVERLANAKGTAVTTNYGGGYGATRQ